MELIEEEKKNKNKKPSNDKYLGAKFRKEMDRLMQELSGCECHYVRCLKPNEMKKKEYIIPTFVFMQIRYLGVLDSIRVRKDGYPSRKSYRDFFFRFEEVCFFPGKKSIFDYMKLTDDALFKDLAIKCLSYMSKDYSKKEVLLGTTKIFMKQAFYNKLERDRAIKIKVKEDSQRMICKFWKMSKVRRVYCYNPDISQETKSSYLLGRLVQKRKV
jgi:myosin heavy subunit